MRFEGVIYDLDGTLLDTLEDIADAANIVLERHGFPTHPVDDYRYFVGDGVQTLMRRVIPAGQSESTHAACLASMREEYPRHLNIKTRIYEGIEKTVMDLARKGVKQAVFSNKPEALTQECIRLFFPGQFDYVLGQREGWPKKPDPAGALKIAQDWGMAPDKILYLGDTNTDMQTAVAASMFPVGALWGFRPREELEGSGARALVSKPEEILRLMFPEP